MRRSLLNPIPELALAAKLLDAAAESVLHGRTKTAARLIKDADIPEIMEYTVRIVGKLSPEVHRQTHLLAVLSKSEREPARMPNAQTEREIFERDGWRCRFCETKVISRKARTTLITMFPSETHWGKKEFERHPALYSMAVSLDHVVPHSRGGTNDLSNFVTACYCCQVGRGQWTLEESELVDPRRFRPIVDNWDGLSRIEEFRGSVT